MLAEDKIRRINQLANKAKSEGLTQEELDEQACLRKEYIESVRTAFKANLESITIVKVDEEGNEVEKIPLRDRGKQTPKH